MKNNVRRIGAIGTAAAALAGIIVLGGGTAAQADTRCNWGTITINSGRGAEAPSTASGHRHDTGNHYVKYISGDLVDWWADNNGGNDGDTWDSYYGTAKC
ncbi:hypothetical protein ACIODW_24500 [Streptomyces sp. NPDC087897]|uniref:hypothetical protein n=1 Tax=Streptomyces sp. NPDC087897 TaxID=3365817 RepID=UPI0038097056